MDKIKFLVGIKAWGNSSGIVIPKSITQELNLKPNDHILFEGIIKKINMFNKIKKYKCLSCGHKFDSDDDVPYCTSCGKDDCIKEENKNGE